MGLTLILKYRRRRQRRRAAYIGDLSTGCASHFGNPTNFKIVKESLLVLKQMILQQKALDFSFNLAP